jgi:hypothetical protein
MTVSGIHDWLRLIAALLFLIATVFAALGHRQPEAPRWSLWPAFVSAGLFCWVLASLVN